MKRHLPLLLTLAFALLAVCSCQHRKSAEEGELFLQKIDKDIRQSHSSENKAYTKQQLTEAEYNYRFTSEQLVRLKAKQIYHYSLGDEVGDKWITEAEAQAISLDNDSLLMLMRRQIFLYYARTNDTIHTLRLFHLQEPLLITRNNKKELNLYHTSLTVLYARLNQMDKAAYWHLQTRRMNEHKLSLWYGNMSQYLMDAGRNDEALLYADSCLNYRPLNTSIRLANAYPVKGQILSTRGQISEAMRLYAAALNEMEEFRQKRTKPSAPPIVKFSPSERLIIYQYAELLYQSGRIPEACIQLERLLAVSNGHEQLLKEGADLYNMRYKRGDYLFPQFLLAQCYQALGQTAKAIRYTQTGDSLQSAYTAYLWQQRMEAIKTQSSNQYLTTHLLVKEQEVKNARLTQYILWSTIALLLIVIASGLIWWRNRRRRLQQLFGMLIRRHAEWQHLLSLLPSSEIIPQPNRQIIALPLPEAPCSVQVEEQPANDNNDDSLSSQTNRQHYLRTLQVMEEQHPFLEPSLDLVALSRLVGISRTQLSTVINQQAHTSFSNWLAEYRINYLIGLIDSQPGITIDKLYSSAGFTVRSTFYRQFRQVTGLTPKQYMKEREDPC